MSKESHSPIEIINPEVEQFTLLNSDDEELQALHICVLAIERHIGHDPEAKHRVAEYLKNRYGA